MSGQNVCQRATKSCDGFKKYFAMRKSQPWLRSLISEYLKCFSSFSNGSPLKMENKITSLSTMYTVIAEWLRYVRISVNTKTLCAAGCCVRLRFAALTRRLQTAWRWTPPPHTYPHPCAQPLSIATKLHQGSSVVQHILCKSILSCFPAFLRRKLTCKRTQPGIRDP